MTTRTEDDDLHPAIRKLLNAWPLVIMLGALVAGWLHMEWAVADHERRIASLEADNKPLAAELAAIKQQGADILARLDRIERRQDNESRPAAAPSR